MTLHPRAPGAPWLGFAAVDEAQTFLVFGFIWEHFCFAGLPFVLIRLFSGSCGHLAH